MMLRLSTSFSARILSKIMSLITGASLALVCFPLAPSNGATPAASPPAPVPAPTADGAGAPATSAAIPPPANASIATPSGLKEMPAHPLKFRERSFQDSQHRLQIPVLTGATGLVSEEFSGQKMPDYIPRGVEQADMLVYHLPANASCDEIAGIYSNSLAKQNWKLARQVEETKERYLVFGRQAQQERQRLIVHLKPQENDVAVEAMALVYAVDQAPEAIDAGQNIGAQELLQKVGVARPGGTVRILCPDGAVHVRAVDGVQVQATVQARAAVDYPRLAEPILKQIHITPQPAGPDVVLRVDSGALAHDPAVRLAYDYTVAVPVGANVAVTVDHPSDPDLGVDDGKVDVQGAVHDVLIRTNGPVWVTDATGKVDVLTHASPILLSGLQGPVTARTTAWWVKATNLILDAPVDLETTDSQIVAQLADVQDGQLHCVTSNSAVRVTMPDDASVDLTVIGARFVGPFDLTPVPDVQAKQLHGVVNGGRVPFDLETSGGGAVFVKTAGAVLPLASSLPPSLTPPQSAAPLPPLSTTPH